MADDEKGWVMHVPVLSTSHIKQDTLQRLSGKGAPNQVLDCEGGAFVRLERNMPCFVTALSPELAIVHRWFRKEYPDEWWIRFDCDGDVIEGLPTYDW